jgi:hypothetical protein
MRSDRPRISAPVIVLTSRVDAADGGVMNASTFRTVPNYAHAAAGEATTVVVFAAAVLVVAAGAAGAVVVVVVVLEVGEGATLVVGVVDAGTGCDEN